MRVFLPLLWLLAGGAASAQVSITPDVLPDGVLGSSYAAVLSKSPTAESFAELHLVDFQVAGSRATYGFRVSSGALPLGLVLSPTGALRGIPVEQGTFRFTVQAVPAQAGTAPVSRQYSLRVVSPFSFTQTAAIGSPFELPLVCPGLDIAYSFLTRGLIPAGLQLDRATGSILGVPTGPAGVSEFSWFCLADGIAMQVDFVFNITPGQSSRGFGLSPDRIALEGVSDGPPAVALLRVDSGSLAGGFDVTVAEGAKANWLSVKPSTGVAPAVLLVTADPAGLPPGTYAATLAGRSTAGDRATDETPVSFVVSPATPSRLTVSPSGLQEAFLLRSLPRLRLLEIGNAGSGSTTFRVRPSTANGGSWLNVLPASGIASGSAPAPVVVALDPTGLPAGTYKGALEVSGGGAKELSVPVTMTVSDGQGLLHLSYTGLTFRVEQGAGAALPKPIFVSEPSGGAIDWEAAASTTSGGSWLSVAPAGGTTGLLSGLVVSADASGLPAGSYSGQVSFKSADAANSPQTATIALTVEPPGTLLRPELSQFGAIFLASPLLANQLQQDIVVANPQADAVTVQAAAATPGGPSFLSASVARPSIPAGGTTRVTVRVDASGLNTGIYYGFVDVAFAEGGPVSRLEVVLAVAPGLPGGPLFLSEENGDKRQLLCTPNALYALSVEPGQGFVAEQGRPVPVEAFVVDNCGGLPTDAAVQARFSNGDSPVTLFRNARGGYSGVWTPQRAPLAASALKTEQVRVGQQDPDNQDQAQITIQANQLNVGGGSAAVGGSLSSRAGVPVISPGGAVSAASYSPQNPLPPGAYISIFGGNLAPSIAQAPALPLPTELNSVSVTAAGRPVALTFVSPNQINGVLPFDLTVDAAQQIVVKHGNALSTPESVAVSEAQPAVFTKGFTGVGPGVVVGVRPDGAQYDVSPETPLRPGDAAVIYCSGLGLVDQLIDAADAAPGDPLARTLSGVSVAIGGVEADVFFAGLAPGFAGLYQVNAIVQPGTPSGPAVPLLLRVNEIENPVVTVAVE